MSAPRCRFCGILVAGRDPGRTLRDHAVDAHPDEVAAGGVPVGCDDPGCDRAATVILVFRPEPLAAMRRGGIALCASHRDVARSRYRAIVEREVGIVGAPRARPGEGREA